MVDAVLDNDHRAIFEIADALVCLAALLDNAHPKILARQKDRLDRIGQLVDVEHLDALDLGHTVQVIVVGEHGAVQLLGEQHQLVVHLVYVLNIHVCNAHRDRRRLAQPVQYL